MRIPRGGDQMKTIKLKSGDVAAFDAVKDINNEIQSILFPLITAVENEAETDTYYMARALKRLIHEQWREIARFEEVMK